MRASACSIVSTVSTPNATGHAGLDRGELQAARGLARDVVEVRRLAAHDRAERDDAGVAARLRERHRRERQLERARNRHDRDGVTADPGRSSASSAGRAAPGDLAVEARDDDGDRAPVAARLALEHGVAVGDVQVARPRAPGCAGSGARPPRPGRRPLRQARARARLGLGLSLGLGLGLGDPVGVGVLPDVLAPLLLRLLVRPSRGWSRPSLTSPPGRSAGPGGGGGGRACRAWRRGSAGSRRSAAPRSAPARRPSARSPRAR